MTDGADPTSFSLTGDDDMYSIVETTGNPAISRTISQHRTIRGAVRAWLACPLPSHKIVDPDGRVLRWGSNGGRIRVESAPAAFGE